MRGNPRRQARIVTATSGSLIATVDVADGLWARMVGLLGRKHLDADTGMLFERCHAIHTWFMQFPIDVLFLDREGEVLQAFDEVQPFRFASASRRAWITIELHAGARRRGNIGVGTHLRIEAA
jgi:uncharacterized membrane protein (UPF0127 family)